jgi:peptide/nickel transport system substrate-binding protein
MKKKIKSLISLILSISTMLALSACRHPSNQTVVTNNESPSATKTEQKSVVLRLAGGDTGLPNPFKHSMRGPGLSKMQLLYDSLLEKDEKGDIPWLAKSWEANADQSIYTFHLQENALWHDGKPLTAEDVAFSFEYYKQHPPVSNDLIVNGDNIVKSSKVIDKHTVEITFNTYDTTYLSKIGFTRIIPKHIWENVSDPTTYEGDGATIGSGPYVMDTYNAQQGLYKYVAFDNYWGLKPSVGSRK